MKQTETSGPTTSKVDKVERYQWNKPGKPGEFLWMNKEELFIDHTYQRDKVHNDRVNTIAANWDWVMCGAISVAIREEKWYVMDGQHRVLAALKRSDIKQLPCLVFPMESQQNEALSFVRLNSQKTAVNGVDRFKAMIVAQNPIAIGLRDMLAATGHKASNSRSAKTVSCVMVLWRLFKTDEARTKKVWPLISDCCVGYNPVDSFIRAIWFCESKFNKKGLSLTDPTPRSALMLAGGNAITAEIRREVTLIGKGGERIESIGLLKWLNKQRLGRLYKLETA